MAKKIAISMPESLFRDMEKARRRERKNRSTWVQEAVEERLRQQERSSDAEAYLRGYERFPETEEELVLAEASARLLFEALDTEDGGWPRE